MPNIIFTYASKLPYHASHKLDGKWIDVLLGTGDTIELTETAQQDPIIKNLVKSKLLVAGESKAVSPKPVKPVKPAKQKTDQAATKSGNTDTNNITQPSNN